MLQIKQRNSHCRDIFCRQCSFLLQLPLQCELGTALSFLSLFALGTRVTDGSKGAVVLSKPRFYEDKRFSGLGVVLSFLNKVS